MIIGISLMGYISVYCQFQYFFFLNPYNDLDLMGKKSQESYNELTVKSLAMDIVSKKY